MIFCKYVFPRPRIQVQPQPLDASCFQLIHEIRVQPGQIRCRFLFDNQRDLPAGLNKKDQWESGKRRECFCKQVDGCLNFEGMDRAVMEIYDPVPADKAELPSGFFPRGRQTDFISVMEQMRIVRRGYRIHLIRPCRKLSFQPSFLLRQALLLAHPPVGAAGAMIRAADWPMPGSFRKFKAGFFCVGLVHGAQI